MRRLLTFSCEEQQLGASLDEASGATGVLMVTGGSQTRINSHRLFERLSRHLADKDFPCFRYDRRGVGDSGGEDPGFEGSRADVVAAAAAFRELQPHVTRLVAFGLCDGATSIALFGAAAAIDGAILVNPWLVEAEAGEPAPAAVKAHYRQRLLSGEAWKKVLTGKVDVGKAVRSMKRAAAAPQAAGLAASAAAGLRAAAVPTGLILAKGDNTAIAAAAEVRKAAFADVIDTALEIDSDSHTFAKAGDFDALAAATLTLLKAMPS